MNLLIASNDKGDTCLVLVLEPGNIHKMKQGQPILQKLNDYFPDGLPKKLELSIFYSETPVQDGRRFVEEFKPKMQFDERAAITKAQKPHCAECKSTIEQLAIWRNESPVALLFCPMCGCTFGVIARADIDSQLPPEKA